LSALAFGTVGALALTTATTPRQSLLNLSIGMSMQSIGLSKRLQMQKRDRSNQVTEMTSVGTDMAADATELNSLVAWDKKEQEDLDADFYGGA